MTTMRRTFKSEEHQRQYDRDGYVLLDMLSAEECARLLTTFEAESSWFSEGFISSVYAPDEAYRRQMDELVEPYGNRIVERYLVDHEVVVSTFMIKGKGAGSAMYPHQDWTLVDEQRYASLNMWMPLIDVDAHNGAMSIMREGHKMPFTLRGSNIPDALADYTDFSPEKLTYMPMRAGQVLIYDHRCIHVSPPNQSERVRPACAIAVVPKGVETFHCFYDRERNVVQRFRADKSFYLTHVASQSLAPAHAELLDERPAPRFDKFPDDLVRDFLARQTPRAE